ncbi:fumarylacetoacetate hydrolase family protein [Alicyclobacillus mengziensis]|uniref:Fumarylacetoacetate hydrolase family protein n=1 Tax=Alicyclobacillus mengziensis TaxID=2931921 RepID=A0A9X7Z6I2_9BACL|nr:fumarylacetoacetate hydrolase family protein [Alicyclobacillus mengziensis]QSO46396.1 fumarylacetoacetate hydrolase family protein [Alicyclobacillus mengziensis]
MRFCTFRVPDGRVRAGWLQDDTLVVDMHVVSQGQLPPTMMEFLKDAEANLKMARALADSLQGSLSGNMSSQASSDGHGTGQNGVYLLPEIQLLPPLPRPSSIRDFYAFEAHVKTARKNRGLEMVPQWYEFPAFYFSNHQAVLGPEAQVDIPPGCRWFDYELEIACVIGREGQNIPSEEAHAYIFAYTIMNDWSARDVQREEMKVGLGPAKGKDFATSLGPWLVTPDELERFGASRDEDTDSPLNVGEEVTSRFGKRYNLSMTASVNGMVLSRGNYRDVYFAFEEMIAHASRGVTLYPGDVIGSGTVGTGCILELGPTVHRWLEPGDVVELHIDGLGTLRNTVKG